MAIQHYRGKLGEFDYDDAMFAHRNQWVSAQHKTCEYLEYIGDETDGSRIEIPKGIKDCSYMFRDCRRLTSMPDIPDGVESCEQMFDHSGISSAGRLPDSVKNCRRMFAGCDQLREAQLPINATDCRQMFEGCVYLEKVVTNPRTIPPDAKMCDHMYDCCFNLDEKTATLPQIKVKEDTNLPKLQSSNKTAYKADNTALGASNKDSLRDALRAGPSVEAALGTSYVTQSVYRLGPDREPIKRVRHESMTGFGEHQFPVKNDYKLSSFFENNETVATKDDKTQSVVKNRDYEYAYDDLMQLSEPEQDGPDDSDFGE